jgi:general stress protein YciG
MTLYHYTYYSYEEFGRGYIGKRSCDCKPEEDVKYFGSYRDKTFKPTQKIILETYDTATEAIVAEIKLQHFFKVVPNSHFANQVYQTSTKFQGNSETARKANASRTPEQRSEYARKREANKTPEQRSEAAIKREANKTPEQRSEAARKGNASRTPEQRSEIAKKGKAKLTPEQRSEASRKANASRTPEQRSEISRKGKSNMTPEQRSEISRKGSNQKWQCTVTGFISSPGSLSKYQRARGIDTSNRIRIS